MTSSEGRRRVLIAITESSPVDRLWQVALERTAGTQAELLALFLAEDHWQRAASLPFTREISRLSGAGAEFTRQRADELHAEAIRNARDLLARLAAEAERPLGFEVLASAEIARLRELAAGSGNLLIASSIITRRPFFSLISSLECGLELVDSSSQEKSPAAPGTVDEK